MSYAEKGKIPGLLMLIDFKKAFDSVSWNFLYEVLKTFGFDKKFINWIKLFNSDISAYVIQCGFLSKPIFGSISGLEVNEDKTKLIWIGSNINSKSRINTNPEMLWGENEFTLLGITFSTDLNNISKMNFEKVLLKAKAELNTWKYRILSPIGKITVLKTLILPKFIHLFS